MAKKGEYRLAPQGPGVAAGAANSKDASFAACVTSLLVFCAICVIIILATYPWMKSKSQANRENEVHSAFGGGRFSTQKHTIPTTTEFAHYDPLDPDIERSRGENQVSTSEIPLQEHGGRKAKSFSEENTIGSTSTEPIPAQRSFNDDSHDGNVTELAETTTLTTISYTVTEKSESRTGRDLKTDSESNCTTPTPEPRCSTQSCSTIASRMLSLMDISVDPCTNFYEYACGSLRKNRDLVDSDPEARVDERLKTALKYVNLTAGVSIKHRFFKKFYSECIDYEESNNYQARLQKAKDFIKTIGIFEDKTSSSNELTDLLVKLFQHNSAPLFEIMLDISDEGKNAPFAIKILPPFPQNTILESSQSFNARKCFVETTPSDGTNVKLDDLYFSYASCKENETDFMASIATVLEELGAFSDLPLTKERHLMDISFTIEELLRSKIFSTASITDADLRASVLTKKYEKHTVAELQQSYTMVNWEHLLREVLNLNATLINSNTIVQVYMKGYFEHLFEQIGFNADGSKLNNALLAMFSHTLFSDLVTSKGNCDRPKMCLEIAKKLMDDTASSLYLSTFSESRLGTLKSKMKDVFRKEIKTLKQRIAKSSYIETQSEKDRLLDKLDKMTAEVGTTKLTSSTIHLTEDDLEENYFQKVIILLKRRRVRMYADYRSSITPAGLPQIWSHFSLPMKTSANAVYGLNSILIPLGVLTTPFYPLKAPDYIQMGTIGSIIAHEIVHHFDSTGIKYDSLGRLVQGEIPKYEYIFQDLTTQLEHQFSFQKSYKLENGGVADFSLPQDLSMNERYADVGALDMAFETYKEWRKTDELNKMPHLELPYVTNKWDKNFFITHAQMFCSKRDFLDYRVSLYETEHLPPPLRVNMITYNSKYFLDVFACPKANANLQLQPSKI